MIGDSIKEYRNQKNLSLSELAKRSGVTKAYLSMLENGKTNNPSIEKIECIAKALDIKSETLMNHNISVNINEYDDDFLEFAKEVKLANISKEELKILLEFLRWKNEKKK